MKNLNNKINMIKKDSSCYLKYIKRFVNNGRAKELFVRNENFNSLKDFISSKKVS